MESTYSASVYALQVAAVCHIAEAKAARRHGLTAAALRALTRYYTVEKSGGKVSNSTLIEANGGSEGNTSLRCTELRRLGLLERVKGQGYQVRTTADGRKVVRSYYEQIRRSINRLTTI